MQEALVRMWFDLVNRVREIRSGERGATAVEYGIMLALIAAVIISVVQGLGSDVRDAFERTRDGLGGGGGGGG